MPTNKDRRNKLDQSEDKYPHHTRNSRRTILDRIDYLSHMEQLDSEEEEFYAQD